MRDRVQGILTGLAAGDRIGGPIRMALRLAESLQACCGLNLGDVSRRYLAWWREGAFDTGPTAGSVLKLVSSGLSLEKASERVHSEVGGLTAGCNPAHRAAPLAMCAMLPDRGLAAAAETKLTHSDPLAGGVSAAVVTLCRALIRGMSWKTAIARARLLVPPEAAHPRVVLPIGMIASAERIPFDRLRQDVSRSGFRFGGTSGDLRRAVTKLPLVETVSFRFAFLIVYVQT